MENKFNINDTVYFISTTHKSSKMSDNYDVLYVEKGIIQGIVYFENEICYIVKGKDYYIRESEIYSGEEETLAVINDSVKKRLERTLALTNDILSQSNSVTSQVEDKIDSMIYLCRTHPGTFDIKLVMVEVKKDKNESDNTEELKESN